MTLLQAREKLQEHEGYLRDLLEAFLEDPHGLEWGELRDEILGDLIGYKAAWGRLQTIEARSLGNLEHLTNPEEASP